MAGLFKTLYQILSVSAEVCGYMTKTYTSTFFWDTVWKQITKVFFFSKSTFHLLINYFPATSDFAFLLLHSTKLHSKLGLLLVIVDVCDDELVYDACCTVQCSSVCCIFVDCYTCCISVIY